jgi:hypothetical protein
MDRFINALRGAGLTLRIGAIPWCGPVGMRRGYYNKNLYQALINPLISSVTKLGFSNCGSGQYNSKSNCLCGWQQMIKSLLGKRFKGKVGKARGFASFATATLKMSTIF